MHWTADGVGDDQPYNPTRRDLNSHTLSIFAAGRVGIYHTGVSAHANYYIIYLPSIYSDENTQASSSY